MLPINYRDAYKIMKVFYILAALISLIIWKKPYRKKVYDNITFLRRFISIYFYNAEEYGSLLAGNSVPPEALKVLEVKENDLVEVALSK